MPVLKNLTALQTEVLAPLIGKIITGFRYEQSPDPRLFSDKFSIRLRPLHAHDSDLVLALHFKRDLQHPKQDVFLNLSINMFCTEKIPAKELLLGFPPEAVVTLQSFMRQPVQHFRLERRSNRFSILFSHGQLIFDCDVSEEGIFLGWLPHYKGDPL